MIIKLNQARYKELRAKEQVVEEIKEENTARDRFNFVASHILIGAGVVVTLVTRVF